MSNPAAHDRAAHDRAAHDRAAHDRAAHDRAVHDPAAHDPAAHDPVVGLDACTVRTVDAERVAATRGRLIDPDDAADLAAVFRLLGDAKRIRILFALLEAGELCVCDLAATTDVTETAVSQSMRLLRTAGIVRQRRDGRTVYYRLDDAHVRLLLDLSHQHLTHQNG